MARLTKELKNTFKEKAMEYAEQSNPYKKNAILHFRGSEKLYLYCGTCYTEEQLNDAYAETAYKDMVKGFEERMVGYYDKWYRYNHSDEGRAYDYGVKTATEHPKCKGECHIIECVA